MRHDILTFTHYLPTGMWANKPRQQSRGQHRAKVSEPKRKRVFGDESSSSSEDDGRTLKQMLESSEEEVEVKQTLGQADQAGSEGDPVASTQIEGHEEDNPDFDLSPL